MAPLAASNIASLASPPSGGGGGSAAATASAGAASSGSGSTNMVDGGSSTMTITRQEQQQHQEEVLRLTLRNRPSVQWDESVVDNEGMGRKSSKRCCIFHKQRRFDESSTDSSDDDDHDHDEDGNHINKDNERPKIARPKNKPTVPDFQRYHA